jgi:hypothetical protein
MALGWIGSTIAFGVVVRKPYTDAAHYKNSLMKGDDVVALHLGDSSVCQEQCLVFRLSIANNYDLFPTILPFAAACAVIGAFEEATDRRRSDTNNNSSEETQNTINGPSSKVMHGDWYFYQSPSKQFITGQDDLGE